jgi:hypothetical protein
VLENCHIPPELEAEVYAGLVGNVAALTFIQYIRNQYEGPVTAKQIMNNYSDVQEKVKRLSAQNRIDQLNIIFQDIINFAKVSPQSFNMDNFYYQYVKYCLKYKTGVLGQRIQIVKGL